MRKFMVAGNWKMNCTPLEAIQLINNIAESEIVEVLVAPPFTSLCRISEEIEGRKIKLAGQNVYFEEKGAFTGEISCQMLVACGCTHAIVGHSERRHIFGENDELANAKVLSAIKAGLNPILCIGETLKERQAGLTAEVLKRQVTAGLKNVRELYKLIIAYEPVWAIGTGVVATNEQINEAHKIIRDKILDMYTERDANAIRILYGGSVNERNCGPIFALPDVDGGLIGGASLKAESFNKIISSAEKKSLQGSGGATYYS